MQVYAPMWFRIKKHLDILHASLHVFKTISRCQNLPLQFKDIVLPVVERNAYGAHPESILCAMISSTNKFTRNLHGEEFCEIDKKMSLRALSDSLKYQNLTSSLAVM